MSAKQIDIAIMGAGAAGLTLAALLGDAGLRVAIVDPYPPTPLKETKASGRTVALMEGSLNILRATGVWDVLAPYSNPLEAMRIFDDSAPSQKPIEIEFPASDIGLAQFGYNIPNAILRAALFERVQNIKNVSFIESAFTDYTIDKTDIKIRLENKKSIDAKLLVAADGRNSAVRAFAGIQAETKKYDQSAMTFLINHSARIKIPQPNFTARTDRWRLFHYPVIKAVLYGWKARKMQRRLFALRKKSFAKRSRTKRITYWAGLHWKAGQNVGRYVRLRPSGLARRV